MNKNKLLKILCIFVILSLCFLTTACTNNRQPVASDGEYEIYVGSDVHYDSPLIPKLEDKRVEPDLDKVQIAEPSKKISKTNTEEKLVAALQKFINPKGNEYDAVSVLGDFRYEEDEKELLKRFKTAAKAWHEVIETNVGPSCVAEMNLKSKTEIPAGEEKASQWNAANGINAESYTNIKCAISSNYSSSSVTLSFDIVKVDGNWYLANTSTLEKLQQVLTTDLFR